MNKTPTNSKMSDPLEQLVNYTRGLFDRLNEFFVRSTGQTAPKFGKPSEFVDRIRSRANKIAPRGQDAFSWLHKELGQYYAKEGVAAFKAAKKLGGMRLVLGGSSRFAETHLRTVKGSLLYTDSVLIPDPIMPWLEKVRSEEKFADILLLRATRCLLQLKPIVDAELPYPALIVFPSWEKYLEENSDHTIAGIQQLLVDIVAWSSGENLSSLDEVVDFAENHSDPFLHGVENANLFVSPDGDLSSPLQKSLKEYEAHLERWRSSKWLEQFQEYSTPRKVLNGIFERITPIYHMLENAQELSGHPLMCIKQQAHYFKLVSRVSSDRLMSLNHLSPETSSLVAALSSRRLEWLSGIDLDSIIQLRMDNENELFRNRVSSALDRLSESELSEVDKVAAEVCREISGVIAEHKREVRLIMERFNRAHGQTGLLALGGLGAALMPTLAPFLGGGIVPLVVATKYGHDKLEEIQIKKHLARSYAGVLVSQDLQRKR